MIDARKTGKPTKGRVDKESRDEDAELSERSGEWLVGRVQVMSNRLPGQRVFYFVVRPSPASGVYIR